MRLGKYTLANYSHILFLRSFCEDLKSMQSKMFKTINNNCFKRLCVVYKAINIIDEVK